VIIASGVDDMIRTQVSLDEQEYALAREEAKEDAASLLCA
jgi:hypothetical protein